MTVTDTTYFAVNKRDVHAFQALKKNIKAGPDQAVFEIEKFGFSTNNISYALYGERMEYWRFFPIDDERGVIPVWGFGKVIDPGDTSLSEGDRFYGYFPMASHAVLGPVQKTGFGFIDKAGHRQSLASGYNAYRRVDADANEQRFETTKMLLFPLFTTSYLVSLFMAENNYFDAEQVLISSASSKTALAAAFCIRQQGNDNIRLVGLTSPRNVAFCEQNGVYDSVLTYDAAASISNGSSTAIYIDVSGIGDLLRSIHEQYGDRLKHSCIIGSTHWQERAAQRNLPGPKPAFFFAPEHLARKQSEWGEKTYAARENEAWRAFAEDSQKWLQVRWAETIEAIGSEYRSLLDGESTPEQGLACRIGNDA